MLSKSLLMKYFTKVFYRKPTYGKFAYTFGSNFRDDHFLLNLDISNFNYCYN